jgi:histone-lysine N-methyltransferase SETMAR
VRGIADKVQIDRETVRKILTEYLCIRKVCAKMVPKQLTDEQQQNCHDLLERQDDFLDHVITGDETWVCQYDPEMTRQSAQWKPVNSPCPKEFHQSKSKVKTMLINCVDVSGIVHYEFVPPGQNVNQAYYLELLKRFREKVGRKWLILFAAKSWILHVDNAPAHMALSFREFLASKQISMLEHPPYSPDLALCDFFLFPLIKKHLKGTHFDDVEDIQNNMMTALTAIPQYECQKCFKGSKKRATGIASHGNYFEGDHSATQQ